MKHTLIYALLMLAVVSCDKFKVPEFSQATITIDESNIKLIINARNLNSAAHANSFKWYDDYAVDFPSSVEENYTSYCGSGGAIYGDIEKDIIRSDRNFLIVGIQFKDCVYLNGDSLETITGNINLDSTFFGSSDDFFSETEGNFQVSTTWADFKFSQHYSQIDYTADPSNTIIKEFSKIEIIQNNQSTGTVNFYSEVPYESDGIITSGEDIIEGANNTKVKIKYTSSGTKYYLNDLLYNL